MDFRQTCPISHYMHRNALQRHSSVHGLLPRTRNFRKNPRPQEQSNESCLTMNACEYAI
jgi:hypothetical protein